MVTTLSTGAIQRRFLVLLALRWLPVGLIAPLLVLILTRDLTLTQVGPLLAIYSITTAVLELPTGGLADAIGRRPVLLLSSLAAIAFFALLLISSAYAALAVAMLVGGVSRALDSGPLESWFVDRSRAVEPSVDLRVGLARGGAVDGVALALGSIIGGLLPQAFDDRLLVSVAVALVVQVVHLAAVFVLMDEDRRGDRSGAVGALATIPATVMAGIRLATRYQPVRRLLLGAATIGVALVALESLWQPRFVDLLGDDGGTAFLGVLLALAFAGGAAGSAAAPRLARSVERRGQASAAVGQLAGAASLAALALMTSTTLAALLFVLFFVFNGAAAPLRDDLMHEHVTSDRRATMVSAESLVFQGGGFVAALTFPALADAHGIPIVWLVGSLILAAGALSYTGVPRRSGAGAGPGQETG